MVFEDYYVQPDAPDPVYDEALVVSLVQRHVPHVGSMLEVDESGGEARTYLFDDVILKVQRPHQLRARTSLHKEAFFLGELEKDPLISVPRVLGFGESEGTEYICMTRMTGRPLRLVDLDSAQRHAALVELGRTLARIHNLDQRALVASDLLPGDREPSDLRTRFAASFDQLADALEGDTTWDRALDIRALADERLERTPFDVAPTSLHSNPGPEHTFIQPENGAFIGLIDFGDAYRSHPALDLRAWPNEVDVRSLLAGYGAVAPIPASFDAVRRTGLIINELVRAARGMRNRHEVTTSIAQLSSP